MNAVLDTVLTRSLTALGLAPAGRPPSYADGAATPAHVDLPMPGARADDPLSADALAAAEAEALSPRQVATPDGFEPGLLDELASLPLTRENVEEVLDELVRPALNADGGDITLVDIKDRDVFVKLVGACNTCPSSIMTMRMGVERLLQDEFPDMGELVQVDPGYGV